MRRPAGHRFAIALVLAASALLGPAVAGCESFAERISCTSGTVLAEDGSCVRPPTPDGGVSIDDCAGLCAMIEGWTDAQVTCLQGNLMRAGPLPTECQTLDTEADCGACVTALGATDAQCQTSVSCL